MKTFRLIGIALVCCLICRTGFFQEKKYQEGDFNRDGVVDEFEKSLLKKGINPGSSEPNPPSLIGNAPIPILVDYKKEKGEFSRYLFTTDMEGETDSCRLAKEANFQAVSFIQFNTTQTKVFGTPEEKAKNLDRFKLEGIIYWQLEAQEPHTDKEITDKLEAMLQKIDALEQKYPGFKISVFLFGCEPDFPGNWHWKGTLEQFCENYTVFVRHLKSKNKNYIVGAPGFAPTMAFPPRVLSEWPEKLVKYLHEKDVSLDFLSFHSYGRGLKRSFHERLEYLNQLLDKYPVKSPVFGRPKIANTEYDIMSHPLSETKYSPSMDSAWRPAHNIMAMLYMMENDVWLASEFSGPYPMARKEHPYDVDLAWIKKDGTIKPVYYGHKLINNLAGTIRIAQEGSNFQTFGAEAGKSKDGNSVIIVLANYDENKFNEEFDRYSPLEQDRDIPVFRRFRLTLKNLPWNSNDRLILERYAVDKTHASDKIETSELEGGAELLIERDVSLPQVQMIKISAKK